MGAESFLTLQIADFAEGVDDRVAALLTAGTGITLTYNDGAGTLTIANTGLGGSTGATDNRILRADGTGGSTVQNSAVTIDDSGNISGLGTVGCGAITSSGTVTGTQSITSATYTYGQPQFRNSNYGTGSGFQIVTAATTAIYGNSNAVISFGDTINGILIDGSRPLGWVNGHALANVADVTIRRNATGPALETRSAGGLRVRNADGSAAGAFDCGAITASGALNVNNAAGIYESGSGRTVAFTSNFSASTPGIGTTTNHAFCIYTNGENERLRFAATGAITASSTLAVGVFTVATLPSAAANAGALAQVTDSSVTTNGSAVSGGGSNRVVVFSNGSTWDVVVA